MTENYIKPEDVNLQDAQRVLNFLNSARSAEEIAEAVEIPGDRDVGIKIGKRILDRRKELGKFINLQQIDDIPQIGPDRFTEIVTTLRGIPVSKNKKKEKKMSVTVYEIDTYSIYHFNADRISRNNIICTINCFKRSAFKGTLLFYKEGAPIPPSYKYKSDTQELLFLSFQENQLADMLETLRQEKPLYIYYSDKYNDGTLQTSLEPVGEEES